MSVSRDSLNQIFKNMDSGFGTHGTRHNQCFQFVCFGEDVGVRHFTLAWQIRFRSGMLLSHQNLHKWILNAQMFQTKLVALHSFNLSCTNYTITLIVFEAWVRTAIKSNREHAIVVQIIKNTLSVIHAEFNYDESLHTFQQLLFPCSIHVILLIFEYVQYVNLLIFEYI